MGSRWVVVSYSGIGTVVVRWDLGEGEVFSLGAFREELRRGLVVSAECLYAVSSSPVKLEGQSQGGIQYLVMPFSVGPLGKGDFLLTDEGMHFLQEVAEDALIVKRLVEIDAKVRAGEFDVVESGSGVAPVAGSGVTVQAASGGPKLLTPFETPPSKRG